MSLPISWRNQRLLFYLKTQCEPSDKHPQHLLGSEDLQEGRGTEMEGNRVEEVTWETHMVGHGPRLWISDMNPWIWHTLRRKLLNEYKQMIDLKLQDLYKLSK